MKFLATGEEMQQIDTISIQQIGIPGLVLMERAALAVTDEIESLIETEQQKKCMGSHKTPEILVVAEKGNNGGDGLAAARQLAAKGYTVDVYTIGKVPKATEQFQVQEQILENLGMNRLLEFPEKPYDFVIDAIFGVGLKRKIEGIHRQVIEKINQMDAYVVSVDIPSGISAATGQIMGVAVKADRTVTAGLMKAGMMLYPGCNYCGTVVVKDIGFPEKAIEAVKPRLFTYEESDLKRLPERKQDGNKGTFGKAAVIAGSKEISGAACLSAAAAYSVGCGMVKLYTHHANRDIAGGFLPEALMMTYQNEEEALSSAEDACSWADVILIGPGLGTDKTAERIVEYVMKNSTVPVIADADCLNIIAENKVLLDMGKDGNATRKFPLVVTPHVKEMSRLTGQTVADIKRTLPESCRQLAEEQTLVCVLKDARTCVNVCGEDAVYMNISGNDGMAAAGSGDVLAGILAGLTALGLDVSEAARLGVYIHGLAGDRAAEICGKAAMTARNLIEQTGQVLARHDAKTQKYTENGFS